LAKTTNAIVSTDLPDEGRTNHNNKSHIEKEIK
jgi:hypothetical protein